MTKAWLPDRRAVAHLLCFHYWLMPVGLWGRDRNATCVVRVLCCGHQPGRAWARAAAVLHPPRDLQLPAHVASYTKFSAAMLGSGRMGR